MLTSFSSPEAERFVDDVEGWLADSVPARWREAGGELPEDEDVALRRTWDRTVFEGGYAGLTWPREVGGAGAGPVEEYLFYEACARHHAPEGFGRIGRLLVGPTLAAVGSPAQRERFLPGIVTGDEVWCQGFSEPGAGSDLAAVATRARPEGDGFVVDGHKIWTSFAPHSHWCVLLARTGDPQRRHHNLTLMALDMRQAGVTVRPIRQITGGETFSEVFFDGVAVPAENVIGEVDAGWSVAMTLLGFERGTVEAANRYIALLELVDLLEGSLDDPASAAEAARLRVLVDAVRWQVMRAVETAMRRPDEQGQVAVLKLYWSELWQELTALGLRVARGDDVAAWRQRHLLARSATIYSGTSEIQRSIIARRVLGVGRAR